MVERLCAPPSQRLRTRKVKLAISGCALIASSAPNRTSVSTPLRTRVAMSVMRVGAPGSGDDVGATYAGGNTYVIRAATHVCAMSSTRPDRLNGTQATTKEAA